MPPTVTIVIPAYNAAGTILGPIEACLNQTYPPHLLQTIVVDDGSSDQTPEKVRAWLKEKGFEEERDNDNQGRGQFRYVKGASEIRYIRQSNAGPASARNTGWRNASGAIVCFTDADCIPHPDWVERMVERQERGKTIAGAVGGSYDIANTESLLASCIHQEIVHRHGRMKETVRALGSYNLCMRREVLEALRGFGESFRRASGEDNDLCYRLLKAGYVLLFERRALVKHHFPERLTQYLKEQYRHGYWRMKLYRHHPALMRGDDYTRWKDVVEPPLCALTLLGAGLFFVEWGLRAIRNVDGSLIPLLGPVTLVLLSACFLLQFILPCQIFISQKQLKFLYLVPVTFLRGFARGLGMTLGFLRFTLRESS